MTKFKSLSLVLASLVLVLVLVGLVLVLVLACPVLVNITARKGSPRRPAMGLRERCALCCMGLGTAAACCR